MYIHLGRDYVLDDLPQCYVLADAPVDTVYLSELSSAAMKRRTEMSF